ncbi:MAG: hypothetical protein V8Q23_04865 [Eubacteriales bacterium]
MTEENKTLALDITPQYRVIASTATKQTMLRNWTANKNASGRSGHYAEHDHRHADRGNDGTARMAIAVADGAKLAKHCRSPMVRGLHYTGTVTCMLPKLRQTLQLTFTTNGFSPFIFDCPTAAVIAEVKGYPTLQAAVDSAKHGRHRYYRSKKDCSRHQGYGCRRPINLRSMARLLRKLM